MGKRKWVVSVVEVNEAELSGGSLPAGRELTSLPDLLGEAVRRVAPRALLLDQVFLLSDVEKTRLERYLEQRAIPYHDYAVECRGEPCEKEGCAKHGGRCILIKLYDHIQRREEARRALQEDGTTHDRDPT